MGAKEKKEIDFYGLGQRFLMTTVTDLPKLLADFGVTFRKGKGIADINNAGKKAKQKGNLRTEHELGMMELYMQDVFKRAA